MYVPDCNIFCAMQAVESVLGEVQADRIAERPSSGGQYVSVKIGPVVVMNPDQVSESANCDCLEMCECTCGMCVSGHGQYVSVEIEQ